MSPRVLLVDDEANIRRMVGALLQAEGFETADLKAAKALLDALQEPAVGVATAAPCADRP